MRSLLVRIFLSFWLIIGVTIGVAVLAGYYYAERMRSVVENFASGDTLLEASEILAEDGLRGLAEDQPRDDGVILYVLDTRDRDLLGRRLPRYIRHKLHRNEPSPHRGARRNDRTPLNLRPARPLPQLVAPDGDVLTFVAAPSQRPYRRWLDEQAVPLFLLVALVASAAVSYLLARMLSGPVQKLRAATVAIAAGDLSTRVAGAVHRRRDELGLLARDFDRMAARLEQAAQQQTELSRNISHELRSPLARLRIALELARRNTGERPEFERIDAETERLDELIGQILSYARLDSAGSQVAEDLDLRDVLEDVVADVNYEARATRDEGVRLVLDADKLPALRGYREALKSAVENVLRNAVALSPDNETVTMTLRHVDGEVRIEIADRGPGVGPDELEALFEPFYRTRAAAANGAPAGNGLGLAIAARAVHLHGGRIYAENLASGGLRVTIRLPLARA
ncbi:MAG: ATP-binding protein [Woeseiaceae bacterium]|nr:ATP-binding protein [Woeseiaceae bacterium]